MPGSFTSGNFPAGITPVPGSSDPTAWPFGNIGFLQNVPTQTGGSLINRSGVALNGNKLQQYLQLGAYMVEPYSEQWGEDDQSVEAHFRVPWSNNAAFKQWALGYSRNGGGILRRTIPASHPKYPWMYCTEARLVKGDGAIGFDCDPAFLPPPYGSAGTPNAPNAAPVEMIAYYDNGSGVPGLFAGDGQALWRLTYRALPYAVITDTDFDSFGVQYEYHRFTERIETQAVDQLPIPGAQLKFTEGPSTIINQVVDSSGVLKRFPTRALTYRWHGVPDVPEENIDACVGTVNSVVFDNQWTSPPPASNTIGGASKPGGYPPGTLLCEAPKRERKRDAVGRVAWTLEFLFLYRPTGWNKFPARDGKVYTAAYGDGSKHFSAADHNSLFQLPQTSKLYQNDNF